MLAAILAGNRPPDDYDRQMLLAQHCSQREQRAERAERELKKVKLLSLLAKQIGQEMDAVITGVERFGLFAQGTHLPAEGLIHINSLQDDYYSYDARAHSLAGRREGNSFRLGDLIRVEVAHVDVDRRELDFRLVARRPHAARSKKKATRKKKTAPRAKSSRKKKAAPRAKAVRKKGKRGKKTRKTGRDRAEQ
jgi:ribonuclease R